MLSDTIEIAKRAGAEIKKLRDGGQFNEMLKDGVELVTTADLASNEIIKAEILKRFGGQIILSEEDAGPQNLTLQQPTWIIDPIDGTVGYANGHYQVAVSVAYAEGGSVRYGAVYNPFLDELFCAAQGGGAYLNGQKIHVKAVSSLAACVVGTGFPHKKGNMHELLCRLGRVLPRVRDIRRLGSPALDICWVACGRLQGFYEGELHPWDVAAAMLIAKEAGARVGHYMGTGDAGLPDCINGNHVLVASPSVYEELRACLCGSAAELDSVHT